jgi:hypothetical protein
MGYLYNQIGEGNIRRSDILFAMDAETRSATEQLRCERTEWPMSEFQREVRQRYPAVHPDDAWIYFSLNKPEVYLSDMYAWLYTLEQFFHVYIKVTLEKGHGAEWWRKHSRGVRRGIGTRPGTRRRTVLLHEFCTPKRNHREAVGYFLEAPSTRTGVGPKATPRRSQSPQPDSQPSDARG